MPAFSGIVTDSKLSADGTKLFAVVGTAVKVFNVVTAQVMATYELGHSLRGFDLSFGERYLVVVATADPDNGSARFDRIDLFTGTIEQFSIPIVGNINSSFYDVSYLSNGKILLSQVNSGYLIEYDFATGTTTAHADVGRAAVFFSNDDRSVTYSIDQSSFGISSIYSAEGGIIATRIEYPDPYGGAAIVGGLLQIGAVSPDGSIFIQGSRLTVRDPALGTITVLENFFGTPRGLAFSPAGDRLYHLNTEGKITVFDTSNWQPILAFDFGITPTSSSFGNVLDISANGQTLAVIAAGGVHMVAVQNMVPYATNANDTIIRVGTIYGLGGNDFLESTSSSSMYGGPGDDTYIIRPNSLAVERSGEGYDIARVGFSSFWALPENIEEAIITTEAGSYVLGNSGSNRITGNTGADRIYSGSGNDVLLGGDGDDVLDGGFSDDFIKGGNGADIIIGDSGADTLNGGSGDDILMSADNSYFEYQGSDDLGLEVDIIDGGDGDDIVWAGAGDSANGGAGIDRLHLSLSGASAGVIVDTGALLGSNPYGLSGGIFENFDILARLIGTNYSDIFNISAVHGPIPFLAGGGDDVIRFTSVNNVSPIPSEFGQIDGGGGSDILDLSAVNPITVGTISPASGQFLFGIFVGSQRYSVTGIEMILLGSDDNFIDTTLATGGVAVRGGAGNDSFTTVGGTRSYGEDGDDIFFVSRANLSLVPQGIIDGGAGSNTLRTNISFTVNLATGLATSGATSFVIINIQNVELSAVSGSASSATGDDFANRLSVNPLFDDGSVGVTLRGGGGDDVLLGSSGNDILEGEAGANHVSGRAGNDLLVLGKNADGSTIDGGIDIDTLVINNSVTSLAGLVDVEALEFAGGAGLTLTGSQFTSGLAKATVINGTGILTVNMNAGINFLSQSFAFVGSGVTFAVNGTSGIDVIKAGPTVHIISAGDGADQIRGGTAADTINGDAGNDKIIGNTGADIITGGSGSDQFRYLFDTDSGLGANADRVTDFTIGGDRLNFLLIDADTVTAGDQAFNFVGTAAFANTGVGQIRYQNSGADLLVQADVNGDGIADMEIILQGLAGGTLTAGDFIL